MSKGIYSIRNSVTSERYIGSSVNVEARWLVHKARLCQSSHHAPKLQAAWRKYGQSCFVFEIIEEFSDPENRMLCQREQHWIDHYDSYRSGYNSTPIASRPFTLTDEERGLREELIRYGLYEPRYIQNIKSQNPLQYDFEAQERWQVEFDEVSRARAHYVLAGWLCLITLLAVYFIVAIRFLPMMILLLPITIWPIALLSLRIGTARRNEWESLRATQPKAIAQNKQDALVRVERQKRRIVRMPKKGRRYW
jgi:GIY-YIG catalytic domain